MRNDSAADSVALVNYPEWRSRGACRGHPIEMFFPARGEEHRHALAICAECPVLIECRQWGIEHEQIGIWGGTSERERRRIRRQLGISCRSPEDTASGDEWKRERMVWLWRQGWTINDIAHELGEGVRTVNRWLTAAGIESAPPPRSDSAESAEVRMNTRRRTA